MKRGLSLSVIPFRNMKAHPVRTLLLLLLAAAQAACVFYGLALTESMRQEAALAEARLGADILVYPSGALTRISGKTLLMQGSPVEYWRDRSLLKRLSECDGIDSVSCQLYIRDTTGDTPIWVVAFEPEKDFVISPWMDSGDAFSGLSDGAVLAGCRVSADADGAVSLFGSAWPIAARLAETGSELDEMVFVNPVTFRSLTNAAQQAGVTAYRSIDPENDFTVALLRVGNKANLDSVTSWLNVHVRKVTAVRNEETLSSASTSLRGQLKLMRIVALIAWLVLLLALAVTQSMMMRERKKELFVWHAVGASGGIISRVMLREAGLIHLAGGGIGSLIAALLTVTFSGISLSPAAVGRFCFWSICLSLLTGCLSTVLSVRRASESMGGQMLLNT